MPGIDDDDDLRTCRCARDDKTCSSGALTKPVRADNRNPVATDLDPIPSAAHLCQAFTHLTKCLHTWKQPVTAVHPQREVLTTRRLEHENGTFQKTILTLERIYDHVDVDRHIRRSAKRRQRARRPQKGDVAELAVSPTVFRAAVHHLSVPKRVCASPAADNVCRHSHFGHVTFSVDTQKSLCACKPRYIGGTTHLAPSCTLFAQFWRVRAPALQSARCAPPSQRPSSRRIHARTCQQRASPPLNALHQPASLSAPAAPRGCRFPQTACAATPLAPPTLHCSA